MRDSFRLYQDKLQGEYKETFQQIDLYFSTQNVDEDTHEEYMGDLLDIFLLAQEEGRPVEKITGKNLESFCKTFCSNLTGKQKLFGLMDDLKRVAWFSFFIVVVELIFSWEDIINRNVTVFNIFLETNLFGYILGFGVAMIGSNITGYVTKTLMFRMKKVSVLIWKIIVLVISIGATLAFLIWFLREREIIFPAWIVCLVSAGYLVLYYIINRNRMAERKANKISFWGLVNEGIEIDQDIEMHKQMKKIFEKKNQSLRKRGKKEFTWQEYLDFLEEDVEKTYRWKSLYDWMPVIVTIPCGLIMYLFDGFSMDFVGFIVILFLVELVLVKDLWKIVQKGLNVKTAWIESARKNLE